MTSFGWKRKVGQNVSKTASSSFIKDVKDDAEDEEVDWLTLVPTNNKVIRLEDNISKSQRLKREGTILAESERFWEALGKWDEAIAFTPADVTLYEMKAQALMSLNELFPALTVATKVVEMDPLWWVGYQTLGRANLNLGEVKMAIKNFSTAIHLNPGEEELWEEDLKWACKLLTRKMDSKNELDNVRNTLTISEISETENYFDEENKPPSKSDFTDKLSVVSKSSKLTEKSVKYSNIADTTTANVNKIPKNYVYMRDG